MDSGGQSRAYVPNELLIQFRAAATRDQMDRAARAEGAEIAEVITTDGLVKIRLAPTATVPGAMAQWKGRSDVEYAAPNLIAHGFYVPNDTLISTFDLTWDLTNLQAFSAWDVARGDPSVVLGIVDTGVAYENHPVPDYERPYLWPGTTMYRQSPELPGPFLPGWDFVHDDAHADDDNGHGTQVATHAAGLANNVAGAAGIAFGVTILPVKVIDWRNDAQSDDIVQGIRFAADHGAHVINLSLGYAPLGFYRYVLGWKNSEIMDLFKPLQEAVNYARSKGAILVGAAGNFDAPEVSLPAGYPGVIAIGATDVDNTRSSYSSYGSDLDFMAPGGDFDDLNGDHVQDQLFALGIKPFRSEGSLAKPDSFGVFPFVGTSAACANASGAVALLLSHGVRQQGAIEQTLRATSIRLFGKPRGPDLEYGWGMIQLDNAVRSAVPGGGGGGGGGALAAAGQAAGGLGARLLSRNPARGEAALSFQTARPGRVAVKVFDVRGALVRTVADGDSPAGTRVVRWDGRRDGGGDAPSGIYFFSVETPEGRSVQKLAFLR
jgi:serine protease